MTIARQLLAVALVCLCMGSATGEPASVLALRSLESRSSILKGDVFWNGAEGQDLLKLDLSEASDCVAGAERWTWSATKVSENGVLLYLCQSDHLIDVQVYERSLGGRMAVLVSIDGNHGQTQDFEFFLMDERYQVVEVLTKERLGINEVRWNEFVGEEEKFSARENEVAQLYINDQLIEARPWTWMDRRWENRKISQRIFFAWNGSKFVKHIEMTR